MEDEKNGIEIKNIKEQKNFLFEINYISIR